MGIAVLKFSDLTVTTEKTRLDKQYELQYKIEYDMYLKRKELYDQNLHKAYAELWEPYATAMKAKLEARTTFESETYNEPIMLIKAIKNILYVLKSPGMKWLQFLMQSKIT